MKKKYLSIPLIVSILTILGSRVYQFINPQAPFILEIICFFIAIAAFISVFVINRLTKDFFNEIDIKKDIIISSIAVIPAVFIIIDSFVRLINYINVYRDIMQLFIGIFGILTGITFLLISLSFYKGENYFNKRQIIALFSPIWCALRLLQLFFIYNSVSNDPWEMLDEIAVIFLLLFLLKQSKVFATLEGNEKIKGLFLWGIPSILFIFSYTSLEILKYITSLKVFEISYFLTILTDLILGIYIVVLLFKMKALRLDPKKQEKLENKENIKEETPIETQEVIENNQEIDQQDKTKNNDE